MIARIQGFNAVLGLSDRQIVARQWREMMGEAKHTSGPWAVTQRDGQAAVQGPATEWIATIPYAPCEGFGLVDVFEVNANARLIAAAPDMLEALKLAGDIRWNELGNGSEFTIVDREMIQNLFAIARAAIAKATGG